MLQHYLSYGERTREELEQNVYSKYQCPDRRSSASSTTSTGSNESNRSINRQKYSFSQMSCQILANTFHKNWSEQCGNESGFDDSLTNLNWLHNVNPMKINEQMSHVHVGYPRDRLVSNSYQPRNYHTFNHQNQASTQQDSSAFTFPMISADQFSFDKPDYKNNPNLKPTFTFAVLISWAMKELGKPKITLSDIYGWISDNFAYYRYSDSSWQNSVRHNLSMNKYFQKVPRRKDEPGKGGFWRMNPDNIKELDHNLSKIKYNPSSHSIIPIKTEKLPIISSYRQMTSYPPTVSTNSNSNHINTFTIQEHSRPMISNHNAVKRPRKSPVITIPENWDALECLKETDTKQVNNIKINENNHFPQYEELLLFDGPSAYKNDLDFSSMDNSSTDSFPYLSQCPPNSNEISLSNFEDDSLGDILASPMLLDGEEIMDNEDFKSMVYQTEYDLFPTSKDDLQELNTLLGIY
uniref:Forkhead box J1-like protein 1 n=1 Tax=Schmidtea mediterranea TaxID=79327 RepID=K7X3Q0_SCHMD|nr:forkhead box J1-like protein 1 [Schmidtea mediterranea]